MQLDRKKSTCRYCRKDLTAPCDKAAEANACENSDPRVRFQDVRPEPQLSGRASPSQAWRMNNPDEQL